MSAFAMTHICRRQSTPLVAVLTFRLVWHQVSYCFLCALHASHLSSGGFSWLPPYLSWEHRDYTCVKITLSTLHECLCPIPGPHTCVAGTLHTKPSPQSKVTFCLFCFLLLKFIYLWLLQCMCVCVLACMCMYAILANEPLGPDLQ